MEILGPLIAATISAIALLVGYAYQKRLESAAEVRRHKQELFTKLVQSIRKVDDAVGMVAKSPDWPNWDDPDYVAKTWELLNRSPEANRILAENREVVSLFMVYADDAAIKAYVKYLNRLQGEYGKENPDSLSIMADFIRELRISTSPSTRVTSSEIEQAIYNPWISN